jgi:ribulose kinase
MCAAVGAGWFDDFATAAKAMQGRITDTAMPDPDRHAAYRARFSVYRQIYPHLREVFAGVSALEGAAS